jgi:hypothetical protein
VAGTSSTLRSSSGSGPATIGCGVRRRGKGVLVRGAAEVTRVSQGLLLRSPGETSMELSLYSQGIARVCSVTRIGAVDHIVDHS